MFPWHDLVQYPKYQFSGSSPFCSLGMYLSSSYVLGIFQPPVRIIKVLIKNAARLLLKKLFFLRGRVS